MIESWAIYSTSRQSSKSPLKHISIVNNATKVPVDAIGHNWQHSRMVSSFELSNNRLLPLNVKPDQTLSGMMSHSKMSRSCKMTSVSSASTESCLQ